jgi:hypothetical protein
MSGTAGNMTGTAGRLRPRRLWLTVPLYVVLISVMVIDVWAAVFWSAVGGSLGVPLATAAVVVVLLLGAVLLTDVRRQWRLYRWIHDERVG